MLLQAQLKRVGIETEVRNIPSGQAQQNMLSGNFDLSLWQMNGGPTLIDYTWDSVRRIGQEQQQLQQAGRLPEPGGRAAADHDRPCAES